MKNKISISIDSSTSIGSVSIWKEEIEIGYLNGNIETSFSKDLLNLISKILKKNNYSLKDLKEIIYTNGPGSFTNLRVVVSTIFGLRKVLGIPIYPISILEAYSTLAFETEEFYMATLLMRNSVAIQSFNFNLTENSNKAEIEFLSLSEFYKKFSDSNIICYVTKKLAAEIPIPNTMQTHLFRELPASDNAAKLAFEYYKRNKLVFCRKKDLLPIYKR